VNRLDNYCLDQIRPEGINYIEREKGSSFSNCDTFLLRIQAQLVRFH
jgi:hypothetical protein